MLLVFARLIFQAIYLYAVSKLSKTVRHNGLKLVLMNTDISPFSYFNKIYIPASKVSDYSLQCILEHEKSHKKQHHFIDLFIIEIVTIIQWFNPVVWLYERSLKEVHEYLADEAVLNNGYNQGKYQALLVNEAIGGPVFILTNQFNQSIIKKRIKMMKRMKTSRLAQFKALFFVPMVAILALAFTNPRASANSAAGENETVITGKVTDKVTGNSFSNVMVVVENTDIGTITDANGRYTLRIPSNKASGLVFSHVGFRTEHVSIGSNKEVNAAMEDNSVAVDPAVSQDQNNGGSSASQGKKESSGMYVATENNPSYPGGMSALKDYFTTNLQYPEDAKKKGIEGKVYVQFTVTKTGKVQDVVILRSVDPSLDKEAVRLVNTFGAWNPASQNGQAIDTKITLPIEFKLK